MGQRQKAGVVGGLLAPELGKCFLSVAKFKRFIGSQRSKDELGSKHGMAAACCERCFNKEHKLHEVFRHEEVSPRLWRCTFRCGSVEEEIYVPGNCLTSQKERSVRLHGKQQSDRTQALHESIATCVQVRKKGGEVRVSSLK